MRFVAVLWGVYGFNIARKINRKSTEAKIHGVHRLPVMQIIKSHITNNKIICILFHTGSTTSTKNKLCCFSVCSMLSAITVKIGFYLLHGTRQ